MLYWPMYSDGKGGTILITMRRLQVCSFAFELLHICT